MQHNLRNCNGIRLWLLFGHLVFTIFFAIVVVVTVVNFFRWRFKKITTLLAVAILIIILSTRVNLVYGLRRPT